MRAATHRATECCGPVSVCPVDVTVYMHMSSVRECPTQGVCVQPRHSMRLAVCFSCGFGAWIFVPIVGLGSGWG